MKFLSSKARQALPWKDGGGLTREIAVSPNGAAIDRFDWRLSMATVEAGGPFSVFENVDRVLAIISDGAMRLQVDGHWSLLMKASPPHAFLGDSLTYAELVDGPLTDLNLMVRRGRRSGVLERLQLSDAVMVGGLGRETIVFALEAARIGQQELGPLDAVLLELDESASLAPVGLNASVLIATIRAV
jgi:environmental stress-induced protein Ves